MALFPMTIPDTFFSFPPPGYYKAGTHARHARPDAGSPIRRDAAPLKYPPLIDRAFDREGFLQQ